MAKHCPILRNSISGSQLIGIDLGGDGVTLNDPGDGDGGANDRQNFPTITNVFASGGGTTITGTLNSTPNQTFRVELFQNGRCDSSGYGEGDSYVGFTSVTTDGSGNASFNVNYPISLSTSNGITATATDGNGNTSEFSRCVPLNIPGALTFNGGASTSEANTPASVQVVRVGGNLGTVTVDYATQSGTATAPSDFVAQTGTLTFADGEVSKAIQIPIVNDSTFEGPETFSVVLSHPTGGATLGAQTSATVTIIEDDPPPTLSIADGHLAEGSSGVANMEFVVTLSPVSPATTVVSYYTLGWTATPNQDFQMVSGTLTFRPGETQQTILVPVYGDTFYEPDETFNVFLSNPVNAALARSPAVGTIVTDEPQPHFTISDVRILEGGSVTTAVITLNCDQPVIGQIGYGTFDGTAHAPGDYRSSSGTLDFALQSSRTITILISGDDEPEPDETFTVRFTSNSTSAVIDRNPITVTIVNDDIGFGPKAQNVALGTKGRAQSQPWERAGGPDDRSRLIRHRRDRRRAIEHHRLRGHHDAGFRRQEGRQDRRQRDTAGAVLADVHRAGQRLPASQAGDQTIRDRGA